DAKVASSEAKEMVTEKATEMKDAMKAEVNKAADAVSEKTEEVKEVIVPKAQ
ncbi:TPA: hypothetical protein QBZ87_002111, partial [Pasteurella multocida]|nr:hypothetical protein [Pasteurella multocida]